MASIRAPKWDWSSHLITMIELYNLRMSIPDIHAAIQCDGFEPCLSSVYSKFRSLGYPTDPIGRTKLLDERFPCLSNGQAGDERSFNILPKNNATNLYRNEPCPLPENFALTGPTKSWEDGCEVNAPTLLGRGFQVERGSLEDITGLGGRHQQGADLCRNTLFHSASCHASKPNTDPGTLLPSWLPSKKTTTSSNLHTPSDDLVLPFDFPDYAMQPSRPAYFDSRPSDPKSPQTVRSGYPHELINLGTGYSNMGLEVELDALKHKSYPVADPMSLDFGQELTLDHQIEERCLPQRGSEDVKLPHPNLPNTSGPTRSANSIKKIRSWFKPRSNVASLGKKRYTDSQFTENTEDSGYASGFVSRVTFGEIPHVDSVSLEEFNGLYRVACCTLHEPQGKAQWRNIPTCNYCKYSSIHNLGWSARYLKLEVFSSELKLNDVYNLGARDVAGNTALHYAAAGGAGFKHLKALIDAGVDRYVANTAGELFIYCLRPLQPFTLEPNSDCFDGDDLIHLLELLEPQRAFDWRDDDGQTITHALALKIIEPDLKAKIFKIFNDAGFPSTVLNRFGRTAEDVVPLKYDCHGQVIDPNSIHSFHDIKDPKEEAEEAITCNGLILDEWRMHHIKQIQAHTIIAKAHQQPRYIDPETGDNVVHALSRLKSRNDILLYLECFIPRGVDLNLHNRDGKHPLLSFICDRSWEESETGATMSKYLDALLWKNSKERNRNDINVNMKDREGATALYCAAVRGRPDSIRSLIEAGANVNARLDNGSSVLQATFNALEGGKLRNDNVLVHLLKEVISHLEHAGAVHDPTSLQERGLREL